MAKYVIKRVAYGVVTLFVLVSLTFFMQQLLPGDPFVGEKNLPEATMEALYAKYGLDKPVWMQYFIYLGNVLHGDLGISLQNDRPVTTVIGESFVVSFDVGIRAILFAFILGVVLGTLAAIKRGTAVDTICMLVALVGVSVPSFIVASLLQYYLGMRITMALKHALRNSVTPVVTVLGPIAAGVLTGGFVVENIFSIPGMGRYFVQSIQNLDYTMISGTTIFYGAFLILANLVVDLVYGVIDPRVKLQEG